ncbi:MAG: protein-L-isoaspartate(D-aspartate) O-methyltransferase [Thermosipho sp. (in: thermotogales)]|nr:protein-L-isoaspartate(D-aspartate) O-methyltransferase [Thermosipho sp. (in: thermotogales)]
MYEHLEKWGVSKKIIEAMNKIDRKLFVPENLQNYAYEDIPLTIGFGQTITAPHMVGIMCQELELTEGDKVLEIGTGSGYNAAVMSLLVGNSGHIYTIERIEELHKLAKERFEKLNLTNITAILGDGKDGLKEFAPFNKIVFTCYSRKVPEKLLEQLADNGVMLIPIGNEYLQVLKKIRKINGKINEENLLNVRFVPLI